MALAIVPHVADTPDRLLVWVGVVGPNAAPALGWRIDGVAVAPVERRTLAPVLVGPLAAAAATTAFTGVFELQNLASDTEFRLELTAGAERIERRLRTLPQTVPVGPPARFNVLLVSCFHRLEDKTGVAGAVLSRLPVRPHLTLFAGDQVYLDLPTAANFPDDEAWLANKFQEDYLDNWIGDRGPVGDPITAPPGFPQILSLAPGAFMPDDHEYWNNYPFRTTPVQNSWSEGGRRRWKAGAEAAYEGFQQTPAVAFGTARTIEVPPLSILVLDTRSRRSMGSRDQPGDLLGAAGKQALSGWVDGLTAPAQGVPPRFGMLVTGQSLFRSAAGRLTGAVADYEFPDYEADYGYMAGQLERLTQAGLPVILATGDVHWGRVLRAIDPVGAPIFEVISSPLSLVTTAGADTVWNIWGKVKGLAGRPDRWPRHSDPGDPPPRFGLAGQYATAVLDRSTGGAAAMRGNQAFMLRFARHGTGLDVEVTCYPLSGDAAFDAAEQWSTQIELQAPRNV